MLTQVIKRPPLMLGYIVALAGIGRNAAYEYKSQKLAQITKLSVYVIV